jgi:ribonuclease D
MAMITSTESLAAACARLSAFPYVTFDTEFLRETTFWPKLCIVQMASPEEAVIVDALAEGLDLAPLYDLLRNPAITKVVHSGRQDLEIFWHLAELIPAPLVDTQIAAMVLGYGDSISYDQLVLRVTGTQIDKSSRFTDWSRRPLSEAQVAYALSDVIHLRPVYERLTADLTKRGRADWVADEMAVLTSPDTYRQAPDDAWQRIKARVKKPKELGVLIEVAAWREREAQGRDVPRGRVLKDEVIADIATQMPVSAEKLANLRSIPKGFERSRWGEEIIAAVKRGLERDPKTLPALEKSKPPPNGAAATVELLRVLLRMTSEKHGVAAKVIATTDDLEAIAASDEAAVPALTGWRREMFGDKALALKHGRLALGISGSRVKAIEIAAAEPAPVQIAGAVAQKDM